MVFQVILCIQSPYAEQYMDAFRKNYPDCSVCFSNNPEDGFSSPSVFLCDKDSSIQNFTRQKLPVIAVSHPGNPGENLMGTFWLLLNEDALTPDLLMEAYCRCRRLPVPIARTNRCFLRELSLKDLPYLLSLQQENQYNPDGCFFPEDCRNPEEFLYQYINNQYPFYGFGLYAIVKKSSAVFSDMDNFLHAADFLGIAGFSSADDYLSDSSASAHENFTLQNDESCAYVSYSLLKQYQHKGYGQEAVQGLLSQEKEKDRFTHFIALIHPSNLPSIALAQKCGLIIRINDVNPHSSPRR